MKFAVAAVALACGLAPATVLGHFQGTDQVVNDSLDIPGESPLQYCNEDRSDDIISIQSVDLAPNPPQAGSELVIKAAGTVYETIEEGAYVKLQVKYGLIRLINTQADLCEQVKNVDMECPIEKGVVAITKSVDLPKEIPPGKYTVNADVYTQDHKHITCLTAQVVFGRKDSSNSIDL